LPILVKAIVTYSIFNFRVVGIFEFCGHMFAIVDASIDIVGKVLMIEIFADILDICSALFEIGPLLFG
jgi:hypothetical protein